MQRTQIPKCYIHILTRYILTQIFKHPPPESTSSPTCATKINLKHPSPESTSSPTCTAEINLKHPPPESTSSRTSAMATGAKTKPVVLYLTLIWKKI